MIFKQMFEKQVKSYFFMLDCSNIQINQILKINCDFKQYFFQIFKYSIIHKESENRLLLTSIILNNY